MGVAEESLNSNDKGRTGWPLWGYPVLALMIFSTLSVGVLDLARSLETVEATAPVPVPATGDRPPAPPPPQPPVGIEIPDLGVSAPVDPVGLNDDGTMEVPTDYARTGWYKGLEAPGVPGTAVIVGHLDSKTGPAVFYRLRELSAGDTVSVKLADGRTADFVVERTKKYAKDRFPTFEVYAPSSEPALRLITCGGSFDRKSRHYRDNIVVYATQKMAA